ncbi:hypothetical protein FCV25MIE_10237 [Fagus crenata]|jgi:hypothetical protein|uniref:Small ribosomal subunit protein mS38 n=1 Tax=Fagus sylvatica TaxID=28930 RepID=A0A2N9FJ98_FAGSY
MATLIHKLTKNRSSIRTITTLKTQLFPKPKFYLIPHQTHIAKTKPEDYENNPIHLLGPTSGAEVEPTQTLRFFPSFPFGYCLNPAFSTGFEGFAEGEAGEVESEDARTVWADSVKKKRKKKMNKHKYKKLRKRLRRKSRT